MYKVLKCAGQCDKVKVFILFCVFTCIYLEANEVEIVSGYGVYISSKQLDMIKSNSNSATKLLRNLLTAFFTPQTLATSSALGSRKNQALDKNILDALFRKYVVKFKSIYVYMYFIIRICPASV